MTAPRRREEQRYVPPVLVDKRRSGPFATAWCKPVRHSRSKMRPVIVSPKDQVDTSMAVPLVRIIKKRRTQSQPYFAATCRLEQCSVGLLDRPRVPEAKPFNYRFDVSFRDDRRCISLLANKSLDVFLRPV
jgi:hypothetical protein